MLIDYLPGKSGFHIASTTEDGIYPMSDFHVHSVNEIVLVTTGSSVIMTETTTCRASGHYLIFYPAGVAHQQINDRGKPYFRYRLSFDTSFLVGVYPNDRTPGGFGVAELSNEAYDETEALFRLLYLSRNAAENESLTLRRKLCVAAVLTIFEEHVKRSDDRSDGRRMVDDALVRDVCVYVNNHHSEALSFGELADRFFISRSTLARAFRSKLGMTVGEYILNVRLSAAKRMLAHGRSVSETADACGFSSASYFVSVFRREMGQTPAEYRAYIKSANTSAFNAKNS